MVTTQPWRSLGLWGLPGKSGGGRGKQVEGVGQGLGTRGCRAGGPRILPKASSSSPAPDMPLSSIPPTPTPQRTTFSLGVLGAGFIGTPSSSAPSSSTFINENSYTHHKYKSLAFQCSKMKGPDPRPGSRASHLALCVPLALTVQLTSTATPSSTRP